MAYSAVFTERIDNPKEHDRTDDCHDQAPEVKPGESGTAQKTHDDSADKCTDDADNNIGHWPHPAVISGDFAGNPACQCSDDEPADYPQ